MSNKKISGELFKQMVTNGAIHLKNNHKEVDHLNVFPVPDGDTGTNMQMTMMAGIKEVTAVNSSSIVDVSKILSRGLLMGARGNSGVILSQFFRGVYSEISKINNGSVTIKEFIQALVGGYEMAYRAVMDPVEGTILTVVRESAERVLKDQKSFNTIEDVLKVYLTQARETLSKTPELLPVLKEAGVVDSGGAGFVKIIEGMMMALEGQVLAEAEVNVQKQANNEYVGAHNLGEIDIKYGYCTEFIVELFDWKKFDIKSVRDPLEQMGDSLVVVTDEDLLKVHVHTDQPGVALTLAQKFGELKTCKIENMRSQHSNITGQDHSHDHDHDHKHEEVVIEKKPRTKYGVIAVAQGDGIKAAFQELGVDYVVDGGQTMNPATEEFIKAIEAVNADNIVILPNNSNIILTAEQAAKLSEGQNITVIKSKTVAQGYSSLIAFDPTASLEDNAEVMQEVINNMKSGELTYAVRDTEINGVQVKNGDYLGLSKSKIIVSLPDKMEAIQELMKSLVDEDSEIVTIFYGKDVTKEEVKEVVSFIATLNDDCEVETIAGEQDVYSYIIAVE